MNYRVRTVATQTEDVHPRTEVVPRRRYVFGAFEVLAAWITGRIVVTAHSHVDFYSFSFRDWMRWDSFNYLSIAQHGRTFGACGTPGFPAAIIWYTRWCGTAGWLPGYSYVVKLVAFTGISASTTEVLVASASFIGALGVLWFGWARELPPVKSYLLLALVADFRPRSLQLCRVSHVTCPPWRRGGNCGSMPQPLRRDGDRDRRLGHFVFDSDLCCRRTSDRRGCLRMADRMEGDAEGRSGWSALGLLPIPVLLIHDQIAFHHWNAYSMLQNESGQRFGFPGSQIYDLVVNRNTHVQQLIGSGGAGIIAFQAILAICLVIAATLVGFSPVASIGSIVMGSLPSGSRPRRRF